METRYKLADLVDIKMLQTFQDRLNEIFSFPSSIIDLEGNILTATAWQDICTKFHRVNIESKLECIKSDMFINSHIAEADPAISYKCPRGLIDNATPIIIKGEHVANFFTGQFFLEPPDLDFFRLQAKKFGFNEEEYLEAVKKTPIWTKAQLDSYLNFIKGFIEFIAQIGSKKIEEIESNKKIGESEEKFRNLFENINEASALHKIITDEHGKPIDFIFLEVNPTYEKLTNLKASDIINKRGLEVIPNLEQHWIDLYGEVALTGKSIKITEHSEYLDSYWDVHAYCPRQGYFAVAFTDATNRVKARMELEESEKKYRSLFENMIEAFALHEIIVDDTGKPVDYRFLDVNPAFEEMTGLNKEAIIGKTVLEILPMTESYWIDTYGKVALSGEPVSITNFAVELNKYYQVKAYCPKKGQFAVTFSDITHQKIAELALTESEEKYRILAENINVGIFRSTMEGKFLYANNKFIKMFKYDSLEDLLKTTALELYANPMDRNKIINILKEHKKIEDYETQTRIKDGSIIWLSINAVLVYDKTENKDTMLGFIKDITEKKKAEAALLESEEKYRALIENALEGIIIVSLEGEVLLVNKATAKIFEAPDTMFFVGRKVFELMKPESVAKAIEDFNNVINGVDSYLAEYECYTLTGKEICIESIGKRIIFDGKDADIVSLRDVTDRKRTEQAIKQLSQRNEAILASVPDIIMEVDNNKIYTWANRAGYEFFGDDVIGRQAAEYFEGEQEIYSKVQPLFDGYEEVIYIESWQRRKDGEKRLLAWWCKVLKDINGKSIGALSTARDITESKKAEIALIDSESRFRRFMQNFPGLAYIKDSSGKTIYANEGFQTYLGLDISQMIGKTNADLFPAEFAEKITEDDSAIIESGEAKIYEEEFAGRYWASYKFPIHQSVSKPLLGGLTIDITKIKDTEKELYSQKRFFEQMFTQSSVSTQILDKDGWCERINPKLSEIFGVEPEYMEGKVYNIFKDEGIRQGGILPLLEKVFKEGKTAEWEVHFDIGVAAESQNIKVKEKKKVWFANWAYPIFDDNGNLTNVIIQHTDITKRKEAEKALRESQERYFNFIANAFEGIYRTEFDKPIDTSLPVEEQINEIYRNAYMGECNLAMASMYNIPTIEEFVGKRLVEFHGGAHNPINRGMFRRFIENGYRCFDDESEEVKPDGSIVHFSSNAVGIIENNYLIRIWGTQVDITERKRYQREIIEAKEKAEQSDKLKTSFLQNMSHEIRTPLNGIMGFSTLLLDFENLTNSERNEYIELILSSSNRLLGIVDDVLHISRIDTGLLKINNSTFQLQEVFQYYYSLYYEKTSAKNLDLKINFPEDCKNLAITTDKDKLYQIISNLMNNALKFTENGSIEFGCIKDSDSFSFYIKDTGIGIKQEYLDKIFERFWQYEAFSNKKFGGTGLGLSIIKGLAELLEAEIKVESEYGAGSTFMISFPKSAVTEKNEARTTNPALENYAFDLSNLKVLIVEDEETNYLYLERLLRREKANCTWVKNGADAVDIVERNSFDLILMDLKMPIMDGFEATRRIKNIKPDMPIIAQTAYSHQDEREKALSAGCIDFISKPLKKDVFYKILHKIMLSKYGRNV
jgi:PAS domain S-box-containing protein